MDEIRVWDHARTQDQIRANMFTALTGPEPGLAGYWNFDDPAQPGRDLSAGAHVAVFNGGAMVVEGERPASAQQVPRPNRAACCIARVPTATWNCRIISSPISTRPPSKDG